MLSVVAVLVAGLAVAVAVGARSRPGSGGEEVDLRVPAGVAVTDPRALRDVAVVRYDALQEMAGQLSFSVALLNAAGDGIVLSSINSRAETRTYAKAVVDGLGEQELSPEEEEAIRLARLGQGPATPARVAGRPKITGQTGARSGAAFSQTG
ncbi:MAG TPA: DUF4446 family protein [Trebonia sp.]|jgi:hypothetical protein|nr:DUF4446 family protein [Trebonia sp.]